MTSGVLIFGYSGEASLAGYELTNCSKVSCGESDSGGAGFVERSMITVPKIFLSVGLLKSETAYAFI
jgi:hypothetical protein